MHYKAELIMKVRGVSENYVEAVSRLEELDKHGLWKIDIWRNAERVVIGLPVDVTSVEVSSVNFNNKD